MFSRWKARAVAVVASTVAALSLGGVPAADGMPGRCPDLYVVVIPGTWETSVSEPGEGMLASSVAGLTDGVEVDFVHYAATAFPWEGEVYGRSKQEATDKARAAVSAVAAGCASTRFALLGYSQGAHAAGDLAAEIGTGLGAVAPDRVVLVGLIADPRRSPADVLIGPPVSGAGAVGARLGGFGWLAPHVYTFCVTGDLYCAMPDGDFAGRLAGFMVQLSNPDPAKLDSYHHQATALIGDALAAGGFGLFGDQLNAAAYESRRRQVDEFLKSQIHHSYPSYVIAPGGVTPLTWLRDRLIEAARA